MSEMNSLSTMKIALRSLLREQREAFVAGLDAAARTQLEAQLAARLAEHITSGLHIASYAAFGSEIDPAHLVSTIPPLLPRIVGPGLPLAFHDASASILVVNRFGIAEPAAGLPAVDPDIVLVPLLGVDRRGHRVGYGGGYYDRTLAALRQHGEIIAIGCAWDCQVVDHVPADACDEPLDAIATPTQLLVVAAR